MKTIVDYAECQPGDWIYIEVGPSYHEIGRLVRVGIDEIGRGIVVIEHARRKDDEQTGKMPTFLFAQDHGVSAIPTTEISYCTRADARYGKAWKPWA